MPGPIYTGFRTRPYDPDAARNELDALGWKFTGQRREKDGRALIIRDLYVSDPAQDLLAQLLQRMMAGIGVDLEPHEISAEDRFGYDRAYDMAHWETPYGAFPLSRLNAVFGTGGPQNNTAIASPELDAAIAQTVSELDESKARELANGLDVMLWEEGRSVPLVRNFDTVAVRETVYNFGAFGAADIDFTTIGFCRCD